MREYLHVTVSWGTQADRSVDLSYWGDGVLNTQTGTNLEHSQKWRVVFGLGFLKKRCIPRHCCCCSGARWYRYGRWGEVCCWNAIREVVRFAGS